jgi:hypothetical protein
LLKHNKEQLLKMSQKSDNNMSTTPSLIRLQESPLVPKEKSEDNFKSILDGIFGI